MPTRMCKDCNITRFPMYMVTNDLWNACGLDNDDILCIHCLSIRANRSLVAEDFIDAVCNCDRRLMSGYEFSRWYKMYGEKYRGL